MIRDFETINPWQVLPFNHMVIDEFLLPEIAEAVAGEFPPFGSLWWHSYSNAIEQKKACNNYNAFGPFTYSLIQHLNSQAFVGRLSGLLGQELFPDYGLCGGGLHTHGRGGKLNVHLDYVKHPKLGLERKLNLIIYLTPEWDSMWGGALGLWKDPNADPVRTIVPRFNRVVIFETGPNSWHGLPEPIRCPPGITRNSLALYYLGRPAQADERTRALFVPTPEQAGDPSVLALIEERSRPCTLQPT